jgi:GNAT superfamily N-acetyltransferase
MSDPSPTAPEMPPSSGPAANARVRAALVEDAPAVAAAVEALLIELGGERPSTPELEEAARTLADNPWSGALLVAEHEGAIVGILAASWQYAIHVPGHYGTIQDLWVDSEWRSRAVGRDLVEALVALAGEQGIGRLEVGLPQESFAQLDATERFYLGNGFSHLGPRMRRLLP